MSKKDYKLIAEAIRKSLLVDATQNDAVSGIDSKLLAHYLTQALEADNPAFDRKRFLEACGLSEGANA